jgi:hypothetical protein
MRFPDAGCSFKESVHVTSLPSLMIAPPLQSWRYNHACDYAPHERVSDRTSVQDLVAQCTTKPSGGPGRLTPWTSQAGRAIRRVGERFLCSND